MFYYKNKDGTIIYKNTKDLTLLKGQPEYEVIYSTPILITKQEYDLLVIKHSIRNYLSKHPMTSGVMGNLFISIVDTSGLTKTQIDNGNGIKKLIIHEILKEVYGNHTTFTNEQIGHFGLVIGTLGNYELQIGKLIHKVMKIAEPTSPLSTIGKEK